MHLSKGDLQAPQSTIFNTSVRGWIALILTAGITLAMILIILAFYFGIEVAETISGGVMASFIGVLSSATAHYFGERSREGMKQQKITL